jgi:spore photoproduct lyase
MKRHTNSNYLSIAKNTEQILTEINNHALWLPPKEANQTDSVYYTYDIACNEDFALHSKHHNWKMIFDFFKDHNKIKASFATKIIPTDFLEYNPEKKIRIRFSLMPQEYSSLLEPNTPLIVDRIKAIDTFIEAGYDVHINYSPVIVYNKWLIKYRELFELVDKHVKNKEGVKAEVIFLTHSEKKHIDNLDKGRAGEDLLWLPKYQEPKTSQFGGKNIRYKLSIKQNCIDRFKKLHEEVIPWNTIRYIF